MHTVELLGEDNDFSLCLWLILPLLSQTNNSSPTLEVGMPRDNDAYRCYSHVTEKNDPTRR